MATTMTYVEFFFPGLMFDETMAREVNGRNPNDLDVPENAFGFRFFDVNSTEENGVKMISDHINISPMYYYGGRIMTLVDVCREMPEATRLISNMSGNGWAKVIKCRTGNFKPFFSEDIFINPDDMHNFVA